MSASRLFLILAMTASWPAAGQAQQPLTLEQALGRAEGGSYANRIADAQARAQESQAALALRGVLPTVRVEGGYVRTTEPLAAFGSILRQRTVTSAAFEPARLNDPAAIGNLGSAVVVEQPIFNADALFGRRAASRAGAAARASETWARTGTQLEVVRAYYGAVLAAEEVATLDSSARAAHAHQRVAESQYRNGLATRSDALLASVRAGQVDAELISARGAARLARAQLALTLGAPADTAFVLPDHLPDTLAIARLTGIVDTGGAALRADVRAAELSLEAAAADQQRASALFLPRVNTFGRLDWNTVGTPFGGQNAWSAGIMVSWSPFSGGAELAERRTAVAQRHAAEAAAEAATARGQLELQQAVNDVEVARARMAITGVAVDQSGEAHRIVARKYAGGLATAVELFDAAAEETASRLGFAEARYQVIVAVAESRRAGGRSLLALTSLESTER